ncbi:NAD(P)-binding protein [Exidia glandulosa HHB12029]|uniref:NAD(P)-binding protein n=1 Tax=Exidia glandulosa HHB12029 TaxID=1314781 RepID=A0A165C1D2_EXIGL|nr:NAD(P)-binding protein [Exidia glandulosa HHB12029]
MSALPTTTREWRVSEPPAGFDALRLQEAQIPALKSHDVLIKIRAVSLQFRDMLVANGQYPLGVKKSPVLGSDAAGEVVAVGSEVAKWKAGDRVMSNFNLEHIHGDLTTKSANAALGAPIDGVLTTYKILPSEALVSIPEHLSFEEASTLPCAALTAYNALMKPNPLKGGDTVLVEGTGGVSIFALQFALASGATPIVITSTDEKEAIVRKLGAKHVINYKKVPDWEQEVLKLTGGEGVDHTLEVSGTQTLKKAIDCTRYGGTISAIGFVTGGSQPNPNSRPQQPKLQPKRTELGRRFEDMNRLISATGLRPVVDKVFAYETLPDALKYLQSQKHVGKVVVKVA